MEKLKAGDKLWVVNRWRKESGRLETIAKVGRLYAHTTCGIKVELEAFKEGFFSDSNHDYFPSEEAYRSHMLAIKAQVALMDRLKRSSLTLEQTQAVNALLGWTP
jgi:hypothetical protein